MNAVPAFHLTLAASSLVLWLVFMSLSPFADKLCLRHHYVLLIYDSPQARCTWWMSINVKHTNKYNFYFLVKLFWLPRWCGGKKNLLANTGDPGDPGSIPGLGRSPGVGNGNLLQYSCLENSMDRGVWQAAVHGAAKSRTWLKWLSTKMISIWEDCGKRRHAIQWNQRQKPKT